MNDSTKGLPQPGEQWVMRNRETTKPLMRRDHPVYPLTDGDATWTEDGRFHNEQEVSAYDLINRCEVIADGDEALPDVGLTTDEKAQIAEILSRRANEVSGFAMEYREDKKHFGSVELALTREIERLRELAAKIGK